MEKGVAITLVVVSMVLILGLLVYVLASGQILIISISSPTEAGQSNYYPGSSSTTTQDEGVTVVLVDSNKNDYSSYNDYGIVRRNYIYDRYGNRIYNDYMIDRYGRSYSLRNYDYYDGMYIKNDFRCFNYYGKYDGLMRTHCSRIHYSDDRKQYYGED